MLAAGRKAWQRYLGIMNDHLLGASNHYLCGHGLSIADYLASGILSLGELTGCRFAA